MEQEKPIGEKDIVLKKLEDYKKEGLLKFNPEELEGTVVYAVFAEGPTSTHPAEGGEEFTVEPYDLSLEVAIPERGDNSELRAIYASEEAARLESNS